MSVTFRCYQCTQILRTTRKKVGDVVACPKCGADLLVPEPPPRKTKTDEIEGAAGLSAAPAAPFADLLEIRPEDIRVQPGIARSDLAWTPAPTPAPTLEVGPEPEPKPVPDRDAKSASLDAELPFLPVETGDSVRIRSVKSIGPEPWFYRFLESYSHFVIWLEVFSSGFVIVVLLRLFGSSVERVLLILVGGLLGLLLGLIPVLIAVALILLAVDIGRSLRSLRRDMSERS